MRRKLEKILLGFVLSALLLCACVAGAAAPDYSSRQSWAYWQEGSGAVADCFLLAPTVYLGGEAQYNLPFGQEQTAFVGALNMERGIYDTSCTMYAPYYRQASLAAYKLQAQEAAQYFALAYVDVRRAFKYYLQHSSAERPLVLAGFSQGADMCLRLLQEFGAEPALQQRLVACYAIGWRITAAELQQYPWLRMAEGAEDVGVIISFNTEAPDVTTSIIVPRATKGVNPLNWRTDSAYADKSLNLGACFTNYSGSIVREQAGLTGAYLDPVRGTLKVDAAITDADYPYLLDIFAPGIFHIYDYQFFYRNLQQNVQLRVQRFLQQQRQQERPAA